MGSRRWFRNDYGDSLVCFSDLEFFSILSYFHQVAAFPQELEVHWSEGRQVITRTGRVDERSCSTFGQTFLSRFLLDLPFLHKHKFKVSEMPFIYNSFSFLKARSPPFLSHLMTTNRSPNNPSYLHAPIHIHCRITRRRFKYHALDITGAACAIDGYHWCGCGVSE